MRVGISPVCGNQATIYSEHAASGTAPQAPTPCRSQPAGRNALFDNMPTRASRGTRSDTSAASTIKASQGIEASQPSSDDVFACFVEARKYYKGQLKASNKIYINSAQKVVGVPPEYSRDGSALLGNGAAYYLKEEARKNYSIYGTINYGNHLLTNDIRSGNCGEMAAVAAKIIRSRFPAVKLGLAVLGDEDFNHGLVIVGDLPRTTNASQWEQIDESFNGRIVDVWAGICCHVREYPALLRGKLLKWSSQEKYLVTPPDQNRERVVAFYRADGENGKPETTVCGYVNPADPGLIHGLLYGNCQISSV
ncbi:hypothetical protein [Burkholderia latens]|uniref:hypothetical protein n=2 Tax=Burkholderia TaxID=32008 RepID=UPI0012EAD6F2|nr:hypothetical protein [Burkholderia latens]QTO52633.1 hypothetical protein J8I86_29450 [Burkholderia latens]